MKMGWLPGGFHPVLTKVWILICVEFCNCIRIIGGGGGGSWDFVGEASPASPP